MSIPLKIIPLKLADYLEVMAKAIFQAGLSWLLIDKRWEEFISAFDEFDPKRVSKFSSKKIQSLLKDKSLILNEQKINAMIHNAKVLIALDEGYSGFSNYLKSFSDYDSLCSDLKKQFRYLGDLNVYYFLFRVGESVPPFTDWIVTIKGNHPRMREMTEACGQKSGGIFGDAINKHLA